MQRINLGGVVGRFLASLILVLATYNPSGFSFISWVSGNFPHVQPIQAVVGVVLLGLWIFFGHATWRSLGSLGVVLGVALFAAIIWLITDLGWLSVSNHGAMAWLILLLIACMLTMGLSWALIRVRVSGQAVVEEIDR